MNDREVRTSLPAVRVARGANTVHVTDPSGEARAFEAVVIAAHADEALALLSDPSADERRLLGAWTYQPNDVVLHTDASLMPRRRGAWASWNVARLAADAGPHPVSVTYHMNRLQRLETHRPVFVTLNRTPDIAPAAVIDRATLTHPVYTAASMATQPRLERLNGGRTFFCGSYFGFGFHEDAVRSAVAVARQLGVEL
jgi:predicted NAD/FAD-binding protein